MECGDSQLLQYSQSTHQETSTRYTHPHKHKVHKDPTLLTVLLSFPVHSMSATWLMLGCVWLLCLLQSHILPNQCSSSSTRKVCVVCVAYPPPTHCVGGEAVLVGSGSVVGVDPGRVVVKRVILSGHPYKINKRSAVIRYMFFNRGTSHFSCTIIALVLGLLIATV